MDSAALLGPASEAIGNGSQVFIMIKMIIIIMAIIIIIMIIIILMIMIIRIIMIMIIRGGRERI